ncbi:unnamed protein product [Rhizoctonia solani]|uniref:Uncharacterized protein n=1 Tax=Rhizoctonia solani TaxID=456999 RepID=A0A8H3C3N2_9AGAM|nr:unnamed protein product [Rhizoctonia solani]
MDTQPSPTQVTKQPEPMADMTTTKHDSPTVSNEVERPSGQVNEENPSKKAYISISHIEEIDVPNSPASADVAGRELAGVILHWSELLNPNRRASGFTIGSPWAQELEKSVDFEQPSSLSVEQGGLQAMGVEHTPTSGRENIISKYGEYAYLGRKKAQIRAKPHEITALARIYHSRSGYNI